MLTGIDNYSGHGFAFPACNASAKTTICGLPECLIHHLLLIKALTSLQMKCNNGPMSMKLTDLTMFPHDPEIAGLMEKLNGLLKLQFQHQQLGNNTL